MTQRAAGGRRIIGRLVLLLVAALALYVVLPQVGGLRGSVQALAGVRPAWLFASLALLALTFVIPAASYILLALRPIRFGRTLGVQVACGLTGKLLPAGLGTLGLNLAYLRRSGHGTAQAAVVVAANNLLGFVGFITVAGVTAPFVGRDVHLPHIAPLYVVLAVGCLAILVSVAVWRFGSQLRSRWRGVVHDVRQYRRRPGHLAGALLLALTLPFVFAAILYGAAWALGVTVTPAQALGAFLAGQLVGTATPTPGGIGGTEAAITAALTAYGFAVHDALSVALLYRLVTYWLPMALGTPTFLLLRRYV